MLQQRNRRKFALRIGCLALVFCLALASTGCVQRRLTIRSNPPGARVFVGDDEIGTTPVSTDFVYYGTRKIRLVKHGYETLVVNQPIPAPWYQIPPLDFVSEMLVPGEIRDERVVSFQLVPLQTVPTDQLLSRAQQLRSASEVRQASVAVPLAGPALAPTGPVPAGNSLTPEQLPPPNTPSPAASVAPPANPVFGPPGGGPATAPPAGRQPTAPGPLTPFAPPPYNPPQYLPPG
jgi:hypothetical protein